MKKLLLVLIPAMVIAGCNTAGDEPGPKVPPATNSEAAKQKTENMINSAPPEVRDRVRASAEAAQQGSGYRPPGK